jgi:hypothetical protein
MHTDRKSKKGKAKKSRGLFSPSYLRLSVCIGGSIPFCADKKIDSRVGRDYDSRQEKDQAGASITYTFDR